MAHVDAPCLQGAVDVALSYTVSPFGNYWGGQGSVSCGGQTLEMNVATACYDTFWNLNVTIDLYDSSGHICGGQWDGTASGAITCNPLQVVFHSLYVPNIPCNCCETNDPVTVTLTEPFN